MRTFVFWVYAIRFSWKLEDKEQNRDKNQKKATPQTRDRLRLPGVSFCFQLGKSPICDRETRNRSGFCLTSIRLSILNILKTAKNLITCQLLNLLKGVTHKILKRQTPTGETLKISAPSV